MTPSVIAAEMRAELRRYRDRTRVGSPEDCLVAKDDHCALMESRLAALMRAIGTPDRLSMVPGTRVVGRRTVQVVARTRVPARA